MGKRKESYNYKSRRSIARRNINNKLVPNRPPLRKIDSNNLLVLSDMELPPITTAPDLPEIDIEPETSEHILPFDVENIGRRIVDMSYLLKSISEINNHSPFSCNFSDMEIKHENRVGLISLFALTCKFCGIRKVLSTEDPTMAKNTNVNAVVALAKISTGAGYSQLIEEQAIMNIPQMSYRQYDIYQEIVSNTIYEAVLDVMKEAGEEELKLAKDIGDVDTDGNGLITVIVDGAWSKRSYKVNYDALSGVACIIGAKTGKLLYVASKNKYCPICTRASNKSEISREHICSKNWSGSSTSMESELILEGFRSSIEMHKLKYVTLIGDGDSSVYSNICIDRPYGLTLVKKVECTNHLLRNYCTHLKELTKKKNSSRNKAVKYSLRKLLDSKILKLRVAIKSAILHHRKQNVDMKTQISNLVNDIKNCPYHVFGKHDKCNKYFCASKEEIDHTREMEECGLIHDILMAGNRLVQNAESLIINMNNNAAETYNSVVAKFVGGKRINFALKGGYGVRCKAAAISFNKKENYYSLLLKKICAKDPGIHTKAFIRRSRNVRIKRLARGPRIKRKIKNAPADKDYGMLENEENIVDIHTNEKKIEEFLKSLNKTNDQIKEIEIVTRGQNNNFKWTEHRSLLLTSSNFGTVCKLRKTTDPRKTVSRILFSSFRGTIATKWGKDNENRAKEEFSKNYNKIVEDCGLFVFEKYPYLGASPDGIISENEIVEIKCPFSCKELTPEAGVTENKIKFLVKVGNELKLKKNDNYYYQVQGQLAITGAKYCNFVVWTPHGMVVDIIERDFTFWSNIEDKLKMFYMEYMIPELIKKI